MCMHRHNKDTDTPAGARAMSYKCMHTIELAAALAHAHAHAHAHTHTHIHTHTHSGMSSYIPLANEEFISSQNKDTPILLAHGDADQVVSGTQKPVCTKNMLTRGNVVGCMSPAAMAGF